jgi:hypothetical protein
MTLNKTDKFGIVPQLNVVRTGFLSKRFTEITDNLERHFVEILLKALI